MREKIFTFGGTSSHDISGGILEADAPDYQKKKKELDERENTSGKSDISDVNLRKLAEAIAGELKPELRLLLEGTEARIMEKISSEKVSSKVAVAETIEEVSDANESGAASIVATTQLEERTEKSAGDPVKKVLSGTAISFLKGLNDD